MEYQALYRKYRPQTFDDVIGQSHVTGTLAREVADGHIAHAYLFAGPRGTGKTTTARILAKALNCENRTPDGAPDNTCASCLSVNEGSSLDVMEMDAASHNSVDDVREMRVSVSTLAASATGRRVFILDEAHMLSKAAGNALLKTLEEPPDKVHFVLATTEPYKLLDTIRSRTQRFDFHAISVEALAAHLGKIADAEGYKADPGALVLVARHAAGSARDSLSLLEQVAALGDGKVDVAGVNRALGLADAEAFDLLVDSISGQDARGALELVARLASQGADMRRFAGESVMFFRGVFLAHYAPNLAEVADESPEILSRWKSASARLTPAETLRAVDVLGEALIRLREGREERLMLELALIRLTRPETGTDEASMLARLDRLERRVASGESPSPKPSRSRPAETAAAGEPDQQPPQETPGPSDAARSRTVESPAEATPPVEVAGGETAQDGAGPSESGHSESGPGESGPSESGHSESGPGESGPGESGNAIVPEALVDGANPASGSPASEQATVDFDRFRDVWPELFAGLRDLLGSRRWALFRETEPGAVVGATLFVDVRHDFHLRALQDDLSVAKIVATKAGDLLGGSVQVEFRAAGAGVPAVATVEDDESIGVDKERLLEVAEDANDPFRLVVDELGADLVDEFETSED